MQLQKTVIFVVVVACVILGIGILEHHRVMRVKNENAPRHDAPKVGRVTHRSDIRAEMVEADERDILSPEPTRPTHPTPLLDKRSQSSFRNVIGAVLRMESVFQTANKPEEAGLGASSPSPAVKHNSRLLPQSFYGLAPDVFDGVPERFLAKYKNPCWRAAHALPSGGRDASVGESTTSLRCMPYFFLAGMPKCGTTDLHVKLVRHPQVVQTPPKEPHWWTHYRFRGVSFKSYLENRSINIVPRLQSGSDPNIIIGDSSASTFWNNTKWHKLSNDTSPGNILSKIISTVLPDAKIIVIFRDPVDRSYSDFNYFPRQDLDLGDGPSIFHDRVLTFIVKFQTCLKKNSMSYRTCTYLLQDVHRISLGMYHIYLRDWLEVFKRDQIKVLRLEDWHVNCTGILPELYDFLHLKTLNKAWISRICSRQSSNVNRAQTEPMRLDTRQILTDFYWPANVALAELLGDQKYLWDDKK